MAVHVPKEDIWNINEKEQETKLAKKHLKEYEAQQSKAKE